MKMSSELKGWLDEMTDNSGDLNHKMFAELIIQKCARLCEKLDDEKEDEFATGKECAKLIRDYFGLE